MISVPTDCYEDNTVPVMIAGGGVLALMMATALGRIGWGCRLVAPESFCHGALARADVRTIAIMADGINWLTEIGVWAGLEPVSAPLRELWLEDDSAGMPVRRGFGAGEGGAFGWNVPAQPLKQALVNYVQTLPTVTLCGNSRIIAIHNHYRHTEVTLDNGQVWQAQLLIAMDGARSPVRSMIGIDPKGFGVNQVALVCHVSHEAPHHDISTEFYGQDLQVTCIPMPDKASAVNIVGAEQTISKLQTQLDNDPLGCLTGLSRGRYGRVTAATSPVLYPVRPHFVDEWGRGRVVLAAEAAHVMPPIGAQGLNISMGDMVCLAGLLPEPGTDPGHGRILRAYTQRRRRDVRVRAWATGLLSGVVHGGWPGLSAIRRAGLSLAADCRPLRQRLIRFGMGAVRG